MAGAELLLYLLLIEAPLAGRQTGRQVDRLLCPFLVRLIAHPLNKGSLIAGYHRWQLQSTKFDLTAVPRAASCTG